MKTIKFTEQESDFLIEILQYDLDNLKPMSNFAELTSRSIISKLESND